jgi:hypothetical protein
VLTPEQIQFAVDRRTYMLQFHKIIWTSSEVHVFENDTNYGIQHAITVIQTHRYSRVQIDLGTTSSSWWDMTMDDLQAFATAYLATWGPDTSPPWSDGTPQPYN